MKFSQRTRKFFIAFVISGGGAFFILFPLSSILFAVLYGLHKSFEDRTAPFFSRHPPIGRAALIVAVLFIAIVWYSNCSTNLAALGGRYTVEAMLLLAILSLLFRYRIVGPAAMIALWVGVGFGLFIRGYYLVYIPYVLATLALASARFDFISPVGIRIHPLILSSFLTVAFIYPVMLRFYFGVEGGARPSVLADKAITQIYPAGDLRQTWDNRTIYEGCAAGTFILVSRHGSSPHLQLIRDGRVIGKTPYTSGTDNYYLDCPGDSIITADYDHNTIYLLRASDLAVRKRIVIPGRRRPLFIDYIARKGLIILNNEEGTIDLVDPKSGALVSESTEFKSVYFKVADNGERLFFESVRPKEIGIAELDHVTMKYHPVVRTSDFDGLLKVVEFYDKDGFVLLAPFYGRTLYRFDAVTLKLTGAWTIDYGLRGFYLDRHRNVLIAQSYFRGWLYALDLTSGRLLRRGFIGRRGRSLVASRRPGIVYALTASGGFVIDIPRFLSEH